MLTRICLSLALFVAVPAWSQADTNATEADAGTADQAQMLTPPPINGEAYPTVTGAATRSNYLRAGLIVNTEYGNNMLEEVHGGLVSGTSYSLWPTIAIDKATSRQHLTLIYSPGLTVYQHDISVEQTDQNAALDFGLRLSPHVTASLRDSLLKTSNVLNQPDSLSTAAVSGSGEPPSIAIIAPLANQLSNTANAELTYQFSRNGMIGGEGIFTNLDYPNPAEAPGLYNSSSRGGSVFYSHRLSLKQYVGAEYRYSQILAYPLNAQTQMIQTHIASLFYTVYLKPTLSLSFSGGPQYTGVAQAPWPAYRSWSPVAAASIGWQERHANFAASYVRLITGGAGLLGAFQSTSAAATARWQFTRTWNLGSVADYAIYKSVTPSYFLSTVGGHSISGTVSLQHPIGEHFNAELGYMRLYQTYGDIPLISNAPNSNREYLSISYQFARPLGR